MSEENLSLKKDILSNGDAVQNGENGSKDAVVRIVSARPFRTGDAPAAPVSTATAATRRDWGSALELVNEACEAIRLAEERASEAEHYSEQISQYYSEQVKTAEVKIAGLEKRLEVAEMRAVVAEEWLLRFHDAIVNGFNSVLKKN